MLGIPKEVVETLDKVSAMAADITAMKGLLEKLVQLEEQRTINEHRALLGLQAVTGIQGDADG